MALTVGNSTTGGNGNGSNSITTVTINKPTGVVSGTLMVAIVARASGDTISAAPSGWNLLQSDVVSESAYVYYKVAGGSEPASYDWSYSTSATAAIVGGIIAIDGKEVTTPIAASNKQHNASSSTVTTLGGTPTYANSLVILFSKAAGNVTCSNYAIATSSPTFTEAFDTSQHSEISIAAATGIRPEVTATGNGTMTISGAQVNAGFIVIVSPGQNVSVSPSLFTLNLNLFTLAFAPIFRITAGLVNSLTRTWNNGGKHDSTWTNQNKS